MRRHHHTLHSGGHQEVGAGRGASVMRTRLQGHIHGDAAQKPGEVRWRRTWGSSPQGCHLGVVISGLAVEAFAEQHTVLDHQGSHHGIRCRASSALLR